MKTQPLSVGRIHNPVEELADRLLCRYILIKFSLQCFLDLSFLRTSGNARFLQHEAESSKTSTYPVIVTIDPEDRAEEPWLVEFILMRCFHFRLEEEELDSRDSEHKAEETL
jgi:hypothetical protein